MRGGRRPDAPAVSVVIAARDAAGLLPRALDALSAQRGAPAFEVVVVDDGSADGTAEIAERHPLRPRVVRRPPGGDGAGQARNAGVAAARGEVLAFTDADCRPAPQWLRAGSERLRSTGAGIVQGAVRPDPDDGDQGPYARTLWVPAEYGLYETANLFVRREWFDRVGGFEDWTSGSRRPAGSPFGEDALFAWRARRLGAATAFAAEALVHHAVLPRSAREFVLSRRRDALFADLVALIPELRDHTLHAGVFLTRRSPALHLGIVSAATAALTRRPGLLAGGLPWLAMVVAETRRRGGRARVAAAVAAADLVGGAALVRGSLRARTLVL